MIDSIYSIGLEIDKFFTTLQLTMAEKSFCFQNSYSEVNDLSLSSMNLATDFMKQESNVSYMTSPYSPKENVKSAESDKNNFDVSYFHSGYSKEDKDKGFLTSCTSRVADSSFEIERELSCTICMVKYEEPKLLPCGHTFCLSCLENIIKGMQNPSMYGRPKPPPRSICCPECRYEHPLPAGGPNAFLTDYTIVDSVDVHTWTRSIQQKRHFCGVCEALGIMDTFCTHCDAFLCMNCAEAHRVMPIFTNHRASLTQDLLHVIQTPKTRVIRCRQHPLIAVNMYCSPCDQLICQDCLSQPVHASAKPSNIHSSHTLHSLSIETMSSMESNLSEKVEQVKKNEKKINNELLLLTREENELKCVPQELKKELNEMVDMCVATLEMLRFEALEEIDQKYERVMEGFQPQKHVVSDKLNSLKSSLRFAGRAFECNEGPGKVAMLGQAAMLLDNTEIVSSSRPNSQMLPIPTGPPPVAIANLAETVREFKFLKDIECSSLSSVKVLSVELGKKSKIEITVYSDKVSKFALRYGNSDPRNASISVVTQKDKHTRVVEFVPCCIGKYQVVVRVLGQWRSLGTAHFLVDGCFKAGDIVRRSPYSVSLTIFPYVSADDQGSLLSVNSSISRSSKTVFYDLEIKWAHNTSYAYRKKAMFSCKLNTCDRCFPLELVL